MRCLDIDHNIESRVCKRQLLSISLSKGKPFQRMPLPAKVNPGRV